MKIDNLQQSGGVEDYFKKVVERAVCDMVQIVDLSTNEEKNNFVKINITDDVDNFIKSYLNDSQSMQDSYERSKYTRPSTRATIERELTRLYNKHQRIANGTN